MISLGELHDAVVWFRDDAADWCEGRSPWVRAVLLAYLVYAGLRHLFDAFWVSWFSAITLAFHELGHIVMLPFGQTAHLLGGSLAQVLVPLAAGLYLVLRQRDHFGLAVCLAWMSFAEYEMATYMADASREQLPMVGFTEHPIHDWSALFTQWRVLNYCDEIAITVRGLALVTWALAVSWGGWLLWRMTPFRGR